MCLLAGRCRAVTYQLPASSGSGKRQNYPYDDDDHAEKWGSLSLGRSPCPSGTRTNWQSACTNPSWFVNEEVEEFSLVLVVVAALYESVRV